MSKAGLRALALVGVLAAGALPAAAAEGEEPASLWVAVPETGQVALPPEVVDRLRVRIDVERFAKAGGAALRLPVPGGRMLSVRRIREERSATGLLWVGRIDGDSSSLVTFATRGPAIVGSMIASDGTYDRLRRVGPGDYAVERVDRSRYPPGAPPLADLKSSPLTTGPCPDDPDRIDVMVVYTRAVLDALGSVEDVEAWIAVAVGETNQSYLNSDVNSRIQLVHMASVESGYVESGDVSETLNDLMYDSPTDAVLNDVHPWRDAHAADIVVLLVESADASGKSNIYTSLAPGFQNQAFAVVRRDAAVGQLSFGHEIGHILSARHEWEDDNTPNYPYPDNHAYVVARPGTVPPSGWRTVMAETAGCTELGIAAADCIRLPYWSNPGVTYESLALGRSGTVEPADNHEALNRSGPLVAQFRCATSLRADVWMKDDWADTGEEPNPAPADQPMCRSPYIWVRLASDPAGVYAHQHQNPIAGQRNFVYVRLHVGSAGGSGDLVTYYASAATSLAWPGEWTEIGRQAQSGIVPGTSRTLEFEWNPPATGHYCLLARWESTADPMRMPEGPIIATNVRNENNIVWRNLTVIGLLTAMPMSSEFRLARSWGFGEAATLAIRPTRGERDARFLRGGTITLHPDSTLLAFWRRQPRLPAAFRLAADSVIVVDPNGGELPLPGEERWSSSPMRVTFARRPDARLPRARFQFDFVVLAGAGSARHAAGGVSYDIVTDDSMR